MHLRWLFRIGHIAAHRLYSTFSRVLPEGPPAFNRRQTFTARLLPWARMRGNAALAAAIFFTLPSTGQHHWVVPDKDADSLQVECAGGDPLKALQTAYLWGQSLNGGGFTVVDSHSVIGLEGKPDSFTVTRSGNYYVTTRNLVGMSCAPEKPVTILMESILTDVPTSAAEASPVVSWKLFTARGTSVDDFGASGVYFAKVTRASGVVEGRKVAFVRGKGPLVNVRDWYIQRLRDKRRHR